MIFESQTRATQPPGDRSASIVRPMLQRKCACGGTPGPGGECEGCKRKRLALQTKLAINQPGDRFEQEADRMADAVVSRRSADRSLTPAPAAAVQRDDDVKNPPSPAKPNNYDEAAKKIAGALQETPVGKEKKDDLLLMRSAAGEAASSSAPPIVHDTLAGSGQSLDRETRDFMEARFSHDFSRVRIHSDARAAESARAVNAAAYTVGNQIVFAAGRYSPRSQDGRRLLAHELTHTLQQGGAQQLRRYSVPSTLACDEVVPWLNSNSPYAPEWAETRCTYSFNGGAQVNGTPLPDGKVRADVKGSPTATVTVNCPVDRPQWNPSTRANRAAEVSAWSAMRATLDAHESAHKKIGATWQGTLQTRFRAVNFSVTGKDKTEAMTNATTEIQTQQTQWQADAQAAQDAIDPFRGAVLACP